MKELRDIVKAYDEAVKENKQTALATVVHVQGSSYRRPGARMLVREDGKLTGAISGGCLEGDALRKAQMVMLQQNPLLVLYDTTDEDDAKVGIQLGCNGIIHILIEPINASDAKNPIELLKQFLRYRQNAALTTLICLNNKKAFQPGTTILVTPDTTINNLSTDRDFSEKLVNDSLQILQRGTSDFISLESQEAYTAFVDFLKPPTALVIVGAGNDAMPLSEIGAVLGWETTVVDGRPNYVTRERFPSANKLLCCKPDKVLDNIMVDDQTVFVLMTHNYNYDLNLLQLLLPLNLPYIGSLGPKKKMERMLNDLQEQGSFFNEEQLQKVFGPTGLDLGAEGAEEIALSIVSEIKMVLAKAKGISLREKPHSIHSV